MKRLGAFLEHFGGDGWRWWFCTSSAVLCALQGKSELTAVFIAAALIIAELQDRRRG